MKNVWGNKIKTAVPQVQQDKVFLAFDLYLDELCGGLQDAHGLTEDQVLDIVFRCADKLTEKGKLPPFPEDDDVDAMGAWLSAADRVGFVELVDRLAKTLNG